MEKLILLVVLLGLTDLSHGVLRPLGCFADFTGTIAACKQFYHEKRCVRVPDEGCSTSDNGFLTKEDCQAACDGDSPPAACSAALTSVPCMRSYFDKDQNICVTEAKSTKMCVFGDNAWPEAETCKQTCVRLPKCSADWVTRACERSYAYVLGGVFQRCVRADDGICTSGKNSFKNRPYCLKACQGGNPADKCGEEVVMKDCNYFYFSNGACHSAGRNCVFGNNAFKTQEDCEHCIERVVPE